MVFCLQILYFPYKILSEAMSVTIIDLIYVLTKDNNINLKKSKIKIKIISS